MAENTEKLLTRVKDYYNPLHDFSTYAYHHIFIACSNTAVAEEMDKIKDLNVLSNSISVGDDYAGHAISVSGEVRELAQSEINQENSNDLGRFYVICNGMKDSHFIIDKLSWYSLIVSDVGVPGSSENSLALEGEMAITEPRGMRFFNVLVNAADSLRTDSTGIVWVVKTVFVGQPGPTSSNLNQVSYISNVKSLMFYMTDVTASFDVTGGEYKITFMGLQNGMSRVPQLFQLSESARVSIQKDSTVLSCIKELHSQMASRYNKCYQDFLANKELSLADEEVKEFTGRRIAYVFDITDYADSDYKIDVLPTQNFNETKDDPIFSFEPNATIESSLRSILNSSSKIMKEATEGTQLEGGNAIRYTYRIDTNIQSTETHVYVIYRVKRFPFFETSIVDGILNNQVDQNLTDRIINNTIKLNYTYTGRNTDVMEFDMKMDTGLAFFMMLADRNSIITDPLQQPKKHHSTNAPVDVKLTSSSVSSELRQLSPVFPCRDNKRTTNTTTSEPKLTEDYYNMLNRYSALENLQASITIAGNPALMGTMQQLPSEIITLDRASVDIDTGAVVTNNQLNIQQNPESNTQYWDDIPSLVHLNIKMPNSDKPGDYFNFWYTDFYMLFGITHKFDAGSFSQELEVMSLPRTMIPVSEEQTEKEQLEKKREIFKSATSTSKQRYLMKKVTTRNARNQPVSRTIQIPFNDADSFSAAVDEIQRVKGDPEFALQDTKFFVVDQETEEVVRTRRRDKPPVKQRQIKSRTVTELADWLETQPFRTGQDIEN